MGRGLRILLLAVVAAVLAVAAGAYWLLHTESGAVRAWSLATGALSQRLVAGTVGGTLRGGLRLTDVRYSDGSMTLDISAVEIAINPDLLPPKINLETVRIDGIEVTLHAAGGETPTPVASGPALRDILSALRLPLPLHIRDLQLRDGSLRTGEESVVLEAAELDLAAAWHDDITVESLRLTGPEWNGQVSGSLQLVAPQALSIDSSVSYLLPGDGPALHGTLRLSGTLDEIGVSLTGESPALSASGTLSGLGRRPMLALQISAPRLQWPLLAETPVVVAEALDADLRGNLDSYRVELAARVSAPWAAPADVIAAADGNLAELRVDRLELQSEDIVANASGELQWRDGFAAAAAVDIERLQPARWIPGWSADEVVAGRVAAALRDGRLDLSELALRQPGQAASLDGGGTVDLSRGNVDLDLEWQSLQWPLAPAAAVVDSREATVTVRGTLDAWTLDGDVALGTRDLPGGRFTLSGSGSLDRFDVSIADSAVFGGRVTGDIAYQRSGGGRYRAELRTDDVATAALLPQWPGRITADFSVEGTRQPFAFDLDVRSLTGEMRNRPISGTGRISVSDGDATFTGVRLRSAASWLRLDGSARDGNGLEFAADIESLADFLPDAAGRVRAEGSVRPGTDLPQLSLALQAGDLSWRQVFIEQLTLENSPSVPGEPLAAAMQLQNVATGERVLQSVSATLHGDAAAHRLVVEGLQAGNEVSIVLAGGTADLQAGSAASWNGQLVNLAFRGSEGLALDLRAPTDLVMSAQAARLGEACIDVASGGSLCLRGEWAANGRYAVSLALAGLPLDLVRTVTGVELEFTQALDGQVDLATGSGGRLSGAGRIDVSPGQIRNPYDERLTLRTRAGFAAFELEDGQLLSGNISLPFSDAAEIVGHFDVLDLARGAQSDISGRLTVNVRDIGVAARIVPQIDSASGRLDADLHVAGTLRAPQFSGRLSLHDGLLAYDPLGLRIENLQLDSEILPGNRLELLATFRSGGGEGRLASSADYLQGRSAGLELNLRGSNLSLIALDDLSVTVDPDLQLGLRNDDVSINGRVAIPAARLGSVNFIDSGVSESDDVHFVGDEIPEAERVPQNGSPLNFSGSVDLELGDQVVIDLDVAEARVRGRTTFRWDGPALPQANGGFEVSGKFEAYGQLLEVTEGSIRYPNVAANNPLLRIRAERDIFGNSQVRRAGVLISGTATRPQVEVYTTPATSQDRALTLLATGSDFNYEQGVGAVDVGTYIAPRLYASYGIGLFDRDNVISVRYDLASGFGVKATSGRRAAGVDISYTIER